MKKITTILLIMISVFSIAEAKKDKTITVYHTNDTHSQIYPYSPNLSDTTKAGRGGFVRRVAFFDLQRKQNPDLLLFDSGDFSQGSPYFTMYKGDVEVGLMNLMGYDAVAIGNHEFDFGLENMARLFRNARFAVVCANYDFSGTPCEGIVKPYTVIVRNGVRIGVFDLPVDDTALVGLLLLALVKSLLLYKCHHIFFRSTASLTHLILYFCALEISPFIMLSGTLFWMGNNMGMI